MTGDEVLRLAKTVLVVDWPSRDVPDSLVRAGYDVVVAGGPGPEDYSSYVLEDGEVVTRRTGAAPEEVDLVYSYRPLAELPDIADRARKVGAIAVWAQLPAEDSPAARTVVESRGLAFVDGPYLPDAVRALRR